MKVIFLVHLNASISRLIHDHADLRQDTEFKDIPSQKDILFELQRPGIKERITAMVLGPDVEDPIQTSQRIHAFHKDLSIILLAAAQQSSTLSRAIQFSPFLGDNVTCLSVENTKGFISAVREVSQRSSLRKQYQSLVAAANLKLPTSLIQTDVHQPTFLGRLLDQAPIGIANLSGDLKVLAWNKYAFELTGLSERDMIGQDFLTLFSSSEQARLRHFLFSGINTSLEPLEKDAPVFSRLGVGGQAQFLELTCSGVRGREGSRGLLVLFRDFTERKQFEAERNRLLVQLREAVQARDEFFSIASHELKTPITSLRLAVQVQQRRRKLHLFLVHEPESTDHFLDSIIQQVDRLSKLIDDMLDISRITYGKLKLEPTELNLGDLVLSVVGRFTDQMNAQGWSPHLGIEPSIIGTWDRLRIEQVVVNLLTNAMKYGEGKPVDVRVKSSKDHAVIQIRDQGRGIKEENLERIFHRFERVSPSSTISGLGLGLYICRKVVEAHGGTIRVESVFGKGSVFIVELPLKRLEVQC